MNNYRINGIPVSDAVSGPSATPRGGFPGATTYTNFKSAGASSSFRSANNFHSSPLMDPVTGFRVSGTDLGSGKEGRLVISQDSPAAEITLTVPGAANGLYVLMWGGGGGGGGGGYEPGPGGQGNGGGGGGSGAVTGFFIRNDNTTTDAVIKAKAGVEGNGGLGGNSPGPGMNGDGGNNGAISYVNYRGVTYSATGGLGGGPGQGSMNNNAPGSYPAGAQAFGGAGGIVTGFSNWNNTLNYTANGDTGGDSGSGDGGNAGGGPAAGKAFGYLRTNPVYYDNFILTQDWGRGGWGGQGDLASDQGAHNGSPGRGGAVMVWLYYDDVAPRAPFAAVP